MKQLGPILLLLGVILTFFSPVWKGKKLPIPADTIIGLYHPYRDFYGDKFPSGIPFKNFLLTDPVRQQFLWKELAINQLKQGQIPWWNPYTHSGTPLLATMQAGVFYPLNFIFFVISDFATAWSVFILLQPLLGGVFFYAFTRHKNLHPLACLVGALSFIFGGFFMVWLEWGNIGHTILWLPLILLSVDKILDEKKLRWHFIFLFSIISQFFAGHLQTSFYVMVLAVAYTVWQFLQVNRQRQKRLILLIIGYWSLIIAATAAQWLPTLQLIKLSARDLDQTQILTRADWFLPWKHLIQFIAPDFFGNPATLNYFGVWNYAEFVGFIGIIPLIFAMSALLTWKKGLTRFFGGAVIITLLFTLPTPIGKLPFLFNLPFLSQAQPSRLLSLVTFSLAVLASYGLHTFLLENTKIIRGRAPISIVLGLVIMSGLVGLWLASFKIVPLSQAFIARRNLILPTTIFIASGVVLLGMSLIRRLLPKNQKIFLLLISYFLLLVSTADLLRFARKFTPFSPKEYLFPATKTIEFLKNDPDIFRVMSVDRRILPPNFAMAYGLQTIEGYDPLYLKSYAHLITELETGDKQDIPIAFNRIISPANIDSPVIDKLNVKYIFSLADITRPKLKLVFQEGETRVYQNLQVQSRARLISGEGSVKVVDYQPNRVVVEVDSPTNEVLELADMMYPGWFAKVDSTSVAIQASAENFRQVAVPAGKHVITFFYQPFQAI